MNLVVVMVVLTVGMLVDGKDVNLVVVMVVW